MKTNKSNSREKPISVRQSTRDIAMRMLGKGQSVREVVEATQRPYPTVWAWKKKLENPPEPANDRVEETVEAEVVKDAVEMAVEPEAAPVTQVLVEATAKTRGWKPSVNSAPVISARLKTAFGAMHGLEHDIATQAVGIDLPRALIAKPSWVAADDIANGESPEDIRRFVDAALSARCRACGVVEAFTERELGVIYAVAREEHRHWKDATNYGRDSTSKLPAQNTAIRELVMKMRTTPDVRAFFLMGHDDRVSAAEALLDIALSAPILGSIDAQGVWYVNHTCPACDMSAKPLERLAHAQSSSHRAHARRATEEQIKTVRRFLTSCCTDLDSLMIRADAKPPAFRRDDIMKVIADPKRFYEFEGEQGRGRTLTGYMAELERKPVEQSARVGRG